MHCSSKEMQFCSLLRLLDSDCLHHQYYLSIYMFWNLILSPVGRRYLILLFSLCTVLEYNIIVPPERKEQRIKPYHPTSWLTRPVGRKFEMVRLHCGAKRPHNTHTPAPSSANCYALKLLFTPFGSCCRWTLNGLAARGSYTCEQGITVCELSCPHHRNGVIVNSITWNFF